VKPVLQAHTCSGFGVDAFPGRAIAVDGLAEGGDFLRVRHGDAFDCDVCIATFSFVRK
jgi:hypothetical protein